MGTRYCMDSLALRSRYIDGSSSADRKDLGVECMASLMVEEIDRMQTYGDWEVIKPLGGGGQSDVFLVRSPQRQKERAKSIEEIKEALGLPRENSYLISKLPAEEAAKLLSEAIAEHARPELPSELGALKVFTKLRTPGPVGEKQVLERLRTEISVMQNNDSPNLLKLLDSNLGQRWIVTEYHPKGTLADHPLIYKGNAARALKAFRSLVAVVASLHHPGPDRISIVHRDIKPANVFLGDGDQFILGDFGIVYLPEHTKRVTRTGEAVGPWDYMPPWAEDQRLEDVQCNFDVYMLGKFLWCMVSGRLRLLREYYNSPQRPEYNLTLQFKGDPLMHVINLILDKCLVQDPAQCLPSAQELLEIVDGQLAIIKRGGYPLDRNVPRSCRVCGNGFYRIDDSSPRPFLDIRSSGPGGDQIGTVRTRHFTCNNCGHIEFFLANSLGAGDR
jgi:serine/threonine protein kinase